MPLDIGRNTQSGPAAEDSFETFQIDRPGRIIFVEHHLSTKSHCRCVVRSISRSGAELDVSPSIVIPKNFFLEILGVKGEIGCTLSRRQEEKLKISFNMLIDPDFLHHVLRMCFQTRH